MEIPPNENFIPLSTTSSNEEDIFDIVKFAIKRQQSVSSSSNQSKKQTKPSHLAKKGKSDSAKPSCQFVLDEELSRTNNSNRLHGINVLFPYVPYSSQLEVMSEIIQALNQETGHLLVESPTGTGKTMMLLCSTLAWQYEHKRKIQERIEKLCEAQTNEYGESLFGIVEGLEQKSTIYYTSRTHKQLNQAISELRKTAYRPKMALLGSRAKFCQNKKALHSADINQACLDLVRGLSLDDNAKDKRSAKTKPSGGSACTYFNRSHKLVQLFQNQLHDIEDLVSESNTLHSCPYFASREMAEDADIVFTPYNYLIDPFIRDAMGINLDRAIVIIDEAHNIEDSARESGSLSVSAVEIDTVHNELLGLLHAKNSDSFIASEISAIPISPNMKYFPEHSCLMTFVNLLSNFVKNVDTFDIVEFEKKTKIYKGKEILSALDEIAINVNNLKEFQRALTILENANSSVNEEKSSEGELNDGDARILSVHACRLLAKIFFIFNYIFTSSSHMTDDYIMAISQSLKQINPSSKKKPNNAVSYDLQNELHFWLLNPSLIFRELSKNCKSVILTSGSLSPLQSFQSELDTKFLSTIEAPHIIDAAQVWSSVISQSPSGVNLTGTFKLSETFEYQDAIGETLLNYLHVIPYGVLCFFPSFSFLDKLLKRWEQTGVYNKIRELKKIFIEPKNSNTTSDFDKLLEGYYSCIDKTFIDSNSERGVTGAIFFAVYRGKASEGINFTNNYARAVLAVGIPYPNVKDSQIEMKRKYNDRYCRSKSLIDGNEWYEIQAFRALNQAIGRCIRHKDDWGAVILLDSRFASAKAHNFVSKWIRDSIQLNASFRQSFSSLCKFFSSKVKDIPSIFLNSLHSLLPAHSIEVCCPGCKASLFQCEGSSIKDFTPQLSVYGESIGMKSFYYILNSISFCPDADVNFQAISFPEKKTTSYLCRKCSQSNTDIFVFLETSVPKSILVHKHFFTYKIIS